MEPYQQLERDWAEWSQLDPTSMVACSSGTAALHLALEVMRLPQGSEVIVPDLCMIAVPRAVSLAGLTPVFVDCDDTLNIDHTLLYPYLGSTTAKRVLIAVHTYGVQCDMEQIGYYCKVSAGGPITKPVLLIEDLAEAHGVKVNRYTDAACYSFYKNKIVSGEEGGAVWFRNLEHAKLARQLRSLGFTDAHDFTHVPRGMNYRMSNVHASLVLDSLRRVVLSLENRWSQWHTYNELCPKEWSMHRPDAPWVYAMRIQRMGSGAYMTAEKHNEIVTALKSNGIEARHCFKSCTSQEEYWDCKFVREGMPAMSALMSREVIYLPLSNYSTRCHLDAFNVIQRVLNL